MRLLVNSVPKSGTNLVQKLVEMLGYQYSEKSLAASSNFGRHALPKWAIRSARPWEMPVAVGLEVPVNISPGWLTRYWQIGEHEYMSGHASYSDHLAHLLSVDDFKVIQVMRHPMAVLLSWAKYIAEEGYYWQEAHKYLASKSLRERVIYLLQGGVIGKNQYYRSFRDVLLAAAGWVKNDKVLTIRFEDLVGSQGGGDDAEQRECLRKVVAHLELKIDESQLDKVQADLFGGTHTFRGGRVDAWQQAFDEELLSLIHGHLHDLEILESLNYQFSDPHNLHVSSQL